MDGLKIWSEGSQDTNLKHRHAMHAGVIFFEVGGLIETL